MQAFLTPKNTTGTAPDKAGKTRSLQTLSMGLLSARFRRPLPFSTAIGLQCTCAADAGSMHSLISLDSEYPLLLLCALSFFALVLHQRAPTGKNVVGRCGSAGNGRGCRFCKTIDNHRKELHLLHFPCGWECQCILSVMQYKCWLNCTDNSCPC